MLKLNKPLQISDGEAAICGRLLLTGRLRLITPLVIGGGSSRYGDSDIVVLKDMLGKPYIPSSSITGALKDIFNMHNYKGDLSKDEYDLNQLWFWGGEYILTTGGEDVSHSSQSAVMIADLAVSLGNTAQISIRDGVRINHTTGIVDHGAKYDFEIVEPGITFNFRMEVIIRKAFNRDLFNCFFDWITYQLSQGRISVGGGTNQGFGRCSLEDIKVFNLDYKNRDHIIAWLDGSWEDYPEPHRDYSQVDKLFKKGDKQFSLEADFRIKHSLIVGSYSGDPAAPDKLHLKSYDGQNEISVIPGTSIRGAIRSRAERIINTLDADSIEMLKELFGWVDTQRKGNKAKQTIKGRIKIEEKSIIQNTFVEEIQYRIKIDRFTGGVINNAFFDSMPVWAGQGDETMVNLELVIEDYKPWEAGLMLLVLKDLWNSDLAIGGEKNVGRGTLVGQRAKIHLDGQTILLEQGDMGLTLKTGDSISDWDVELAQELEDLVAALLKEVKKYPADKNGSEVPSDAK